MPKSQSLSGQTTLFDEPVDDEPVDDEPVDELDPDNIVKDFLAKHLNPITQQAYASDIRDLFGGDPLPDAVRTFLQSSEAIVHQRLLNYEKHLRSRKLGLSTIARRLNTLRSFLRFAFQRGLTPCNGHHVYPSGILSPASSPAKKALSTQGVKGAEQKERATSKEATSKRLAPNRASKEKQKLKDQKIAQEQKQLEIMEAGVVAKLMAAPDLSTLRGLRDRALLGLLAECALHRSQLCRLDVEHYQKGQATKDGQATEGEDREKARLTIITLDKKNRPQTSFVFPRAQTIDALDRYLSASGDQDQPHSPLFCNVDRRHLVQGERLTADGIYYLIAEYGQQIEAPHLNSRFLRQWAIRTVLQSVNGNVSEARKLLWHISLNTLARYGRSVRLARPIGSPSVDKAEERPMT